jgi:Xaa-Pro dipeptidase
MSNVTGWLLERYQERVREPPTIGFRQAENGAIAAFDPAELTLRRLGRLQTEIQRQGYGGAVFFDPLNVRYATGSRNMSVWLLHNPARYCFVPAAGRPVMFEFPNHNCQLNSVGNVVLAEVRPAKAHFFTMAAEHRDAVAEAWADEIADLLKFAAGASGTLAIDRLDPVGFYALQKRGIRIGDGIEVAERARLIKCPAEMDLIKNAVRVAEIGITRMQETLRPQMTENALWSVLHSTNIEFGGEWLESRLLSSGPRTNPWYQECSDRRIQPGDVVSLDTDMIGPHGYCADISRTFVCGPSSAVTPGQRDLYLLALDQVRTNASLLAPGVSFRELAERAWKIPQRFRKKFYGMLAHGVGMADEGPVISYDPADPLAPIGELLPGMCISVESYIGAENGGEGVKLEEQYAITQTGAIALGSQGLPELLVCADNL